MTTSSSSSAAQTTREATEHYSGSDFRDRNTELAYQRRDIKAAIEPLEAIEADERSAAQRRELGRLARQLDKVTTEMVELNYGLVRKYVKRFTGRTTRGDAEEFEQAAVLGLMSAIDTFNPDEGRFSSWAWSRIVRETLVAVRNTDHPNLNMTDFEIQPKVDKAVRKWELEHPHTSPDREWVAETAGVTSEQARRVLDKHSLLSTETPLSDEGGATIGDMITEPEGDIADTVISQITQEALEQHALPQLTAQELFVMLRRLGLDAEPEQNLLEIGDMLSLSREAVRQAYLRGMAKLKHPRVLKPCLEAMAG